MGIVGIQMVVVACSGQVPISPSVESIQSNSNQPTISRHYHGKSLPSEMMYVLGGTQKSRSPFIEVFDAQDTSPSPSPLYTIPPNGDGGFGFLAVDSQNNLFTVKVAGSITKLYMYPSGQTKPSVVCLLPSIPNDTYIADGVLYIVTRSNTINEYPEPFETGKDCPSPTKVLTDKIAERKSNTDVIGVAADPFGNVFDSWQADPTNGFMDEFNAGSNHAHSYARLGNYYSSSSLTSDHKGNIITDIQNSTEHPVDSLAVFPRGSKTPNLFDPISNGQYLGVAVGTHDTELFVVVNYPVIEVQVYSYNAKRAAIGSLKRTFTNLWFYDQSIAVFPP